MQWESVGRSTVVCFLVGRGGLSKARRRSLEAEAALHRDVLLLDAVLTCDMRIGLQPGCTIIACAAPCCSLPSSKRRWRAVLARKAMECRVCALRTVCTRRTFAAHATCDMRIERAAAAVHAPCAVPASGAPRTVCRCHHRLDVADRVVLSLPKTFGWWQAAAALIARGTAVRWVAKVVARP